MGLVQIHNDNTSETKLYNRVCVVISTKMEFIELTGYSSKVRIGD
jgi:hypothetical protein